MVLFWGLTLLLGAIIIYLIDYIVTKRRIDYWRKNGIPSNEISPLKSLRQMFIPKKNVSEVIHDRYNEMKREKYAGFHDFFLKGLIINDPDIINRMLIKDFSNFVDRQIPNIGDKNDLFNLNLVFLDGDRWRNARHKLVPAFTSGKLRLMFGPIKESTDIVIRYINDKKSEDLEVKDLMHKLILKIIGSVTFGLNIDTLNQEDEKSKEFLESISKFFKFSPKQTLKMLCNVIAPKMFRFKFLDDDVEMFFRNLTKDLIKFRETSDKKRNDFLNILLDEKKKEECNSQNESNISSLESYETVESEDRELVEQLKNTSTSTLNSNSSELFTEDFITAQAFAFISIGSDSTSTALSYILYELAVNKNVQERLQKEINDILSIHGFNYDSISKMDYLEQCIYETLRIHPILSHLTRACTADYKLPGTDYILKKGMAIVIPVVGLHKDPQYFHEPDKFNPDRFEDLKSVQKGVFFPFGSGPRFCIAMRLAMLEMKIVLAAILSNFTIDISKNQKLPLKMKTSSLFGDAEGGILITFKSKKE